MGTKANISVSLVIFLLLIGSLGTAPAQGQPWSGSGMEGDPYLIEDANDMQAIGADPNYWDAHFMLVNDINLAQFTGTQFNIIGRSPVLFTGVFDGNGHSINHFTYLAEDSSQVGLFGSVSGEHITIKNLILNDVNIAGDRRVGALVGVLYGGISGCSVVSGRVSGKGMVGGLAGLLEPGRDHLKCISDCYAIVDVQGGSGTGGLVGYSHWSIERCFSSGSVKGENGVGGLTGTHYRLGIISNCYSLCAVNGNDYVGGLIGITVRPVDNCLSAGIVDGNELSGAFVGGGAYTTYTKCFWDTEINPDANGIGDGSDPNVIGLTTEQMHRRSTFADAGWDMVNVWDIGENQTYPFLRTHLPSDINKDDETNFLDLAILTENWLGEK